jgi:hypothetical protein
MVIIFNLSSRHFGAAGSAVTGFGMSMDVLPQKIVTLNRLKHETSVVMESFASGCSVGGLRYLLCTVFHQANG